MELQMKVLESGNRIALADIPMLGFGDFKADLLNSCGNGKGARVVSLFALPGHENHLIAVVADDKAGTIGALSTMVGSTYPSLTPDLPQVHLFERELFENDGLRPQGHPWLKSLRKPFETDFFRMKRGIPRSGVGPVQPASSRPVISIPCYGENVEHLEFSWATSIAASKTRLSGAPDGRTIHLMGRLQAIIRSPTVSPMRAFFRIVDGATVPARAEALRAVALELERIANHVGDLGALAGDVGYLPTKSFCGRLRGDFLNLTAELCGNRFGRNFIRPGGVAFDIDDALARSLADRLESLLSQTDDAVELLWGTPSVLARFEHTGVITRQDAIEVGLVGPAARASGLDLDARSDHPTGMYRYTSIPVSTFPTGDVYARGMVRMLEYRRSARFILDTLASLPAWDSEEKPKIPCRQGAGGIARRRLARRDLPCAITGPVGNYCGTDTDPSSKNAFESFACLRGQQFSDFPL